MISLKIAVSFFKFAGKARFPAINAHLLKFLSISTLSLRHFPSGVHFLFFFILRGFKI